MLGSHVAHISWETGEFQCQCKAMNSEFSIEYLTWIKTGPKPAQTENHFAATIFSVKLSVFLG